MTFLETDPKKTTAEAFWDCKWMTDQDELTNTNMSSFILEGAFEVTQAETVCDLKVMSGLISRSDPPSWRNISSL